MSGRTEDLLPWRAALLAGAIPLLVLGFLTSALANRLVFLAWGLGAALAFAWTLRRGFEASFGSRQEPSRDYDGGDSGGDARATLRIAAGTSLVLGLALLAFAALVVGFGEELDAAFHAFLPALYHPWWARPATSLAVGAALILFSIAARLFLRRSSQRQGAASGRPS